MFWELASEDEGFTERREPVAVVRHAVASMRCLQSESPGRESQALVFLMRLEHDPHYASPEQSRGGDRTSHSLVYSVGVLLFERLTGHHPFVASFSPLKAVIMRDSTGAHGAGPLCHVPEELRAVLNRAMSAFPGDRYTDVAELRRALEAYLRSQGARRRRARSVPPPCPHSVARHLRDAQGHGPDQAEMRSAATSTAVWATGSDLARTLP